MPTLQFTFENDDGNCDQALLALYDRATELDADFEREARQERAMGC